MSERPNILFILSDQQRWDSLVDDVNFDAVRAQLEERFMQLFSDIRPDLELYYKI